MDGKSGPVLIFLYGTGSDARLLVSLVPSPPHPGTRLVDSHGFDRWSLVLLMIRATTLNDGGLPGAFGLGPCPKLHFP